MDLHDKTYQALLVYSGFCPFIGPCAKVEIINTNRYRRQGTTEWFDMP
jgi:hypothetical protein